MSITTAGAAAHYEKAYQLGIKEGGAPKVLKDILSADGISYPAEYPLGLLQIPLEQIAGTYEEARKHSFSEGFYPVIEPGSEFASKWTELCRAHMEEGIHTPVRAYEYMNLYYILEGNKRVSVLKYFGADSIPAEVTRIMPPIGQSEEVKVNYEYIDFFHLTGINYIYFRHQGLFPRLLRLTGKKPYESWNDDDRTDFGSVYTRFREETEKMIGSLSYLDASAAFLTFLSFNDYRSLADLSMSDFRGLVQKAAPELERAVSTDPVSVRLDPEEAKPGLLQSTLQTTLQSSIFHSLLPGTDDCLRIGFVFHKRPEDSGWSRAHDNARRSVQRIFGERVATFSRYDVDTGDITDAISDLSDEGCGLIFTTSSIFLKGSIQAALDHPSLKILNCSLNKPQKAVRTYYARMYEVKFLMGAIAAALSDDHRLGFVADFPIYGTIAGINAFALGAQMIDPKVRIYLTWSCIRDHDPDAFLRENGLSVVCAKDYDVGVSDRRYGLYKIREDGIWTVAVPVWHWSAFYEKITDSVLKGTWKADEPKDKAQGISYWWGMSAGMVSLIYSRKLPVGTLRLIRALRDAVCMGTLLPFNGPLLSQNGVIRKSVSESLTPEEIIGMDWLANNIMGAIPDASQLDEEAKTLADFQSVRSRENIL